MHDFETYIFKTFAQTIRTWNASIAGDIYALAFLALNDDDDLRRPTVRLLYNTEAEWRRQCECANAPGVPRLCQPTSPAEARWNHPFWLQTAQASIGTTYPDFGSPFDSEGIALREAWIKQQKLWYDDLFQEKAFEQALELGGRICEQFDQMCVRVATQLRDGGILREVFGRDVPIIFFDREALSPQAIALTYQANPQTLIAEYSAFVDEIVPGKGA